MKNALNSLALLGLLALASPASAQSVDISIPFPVIPRLVVVSPGIQVVEDHDDEVFFVDDYYWVRRDRRWWRSRSWRGGWAVVERRRVPERLVAVPVGRYRHYHRAEPVRVVHERTVVVEHDGEHGHGDHHHGGKHHGGKHHGGKHHGKGRGRH